MKKFSSFMSGFLLGAMLGTVVALLNAPNTGEDTRNLLLKKGKELRTTAEQKLVEGQRGVQETLSKVKGKAAEGLEVSSEKLQEAAEEISESVPETEKA